MFAWIWRTSSYFKIFDFSISKGPEEINMNQLDYFQHDLNKLEDRDYENLTTRKTKNAVSSPGKRNDTPEEAPGICLIESL